MKPVVVEKPSILSQGGIVIELFEAVEYALRLERAYRLDLLSQGYKKGDIQIDSCDDNIKRFTDLIEKARKAA